MKKFIVLISLALVALIPLSAQETTSKINKKNLVIKEWITDARSGKKVLDHVTTFSPDGQKVEEIEYGSSGQKWRKRYEYGENGKVARELLYDEFNKLVSIKKFEYNEFLRKKTQYTYDPKGKLKSIKTYEYITEDA